MADSRTSRELITSLCRASTDAFRPSYPAIDLVSSRPSLPTVRLHPNGSSRPSGDSASTTPTHASKTPSVPGSTEQSPSSRAERRPDAGLIKRLQASKMKTWPRSQSVSHHKPDLTESSGNPGSMRGSMGNAYTDGGSPSPMVDTVAPPHHSGSDRRRPSPMNVDGNNVAIHHSTHALMTTGPRNTSPATRSIIPQNRKESSRPSIAIGSSGISNRGTTGFAPAAPIRTNSPATQNANSFTADINRAIPTYTQSEPATKIVQSREVGPSSPRPRVSRSPSFEILDQETFAQRTTPSKKRKLTTFPPNDVASSVRSEMPSKTSAAMDLSGQEVELLNGIEEHAEAVPMDLLESLLQDEDMAGTAQEDKIASDRAATPTTMAATDTARNDAQSTVRLAGWKAPHASSRTDDKDRAHNLLMSLVEAASNAGKAQPSTSISRSTAPPPAVAASKGASTTTIAGDAKHPVSVINLNLSVPLNANIPASSQSGKTSNKAPVFKVPHPVGSNFKGKEPVRPQIPFTREASPEIPVATTTERQALWMKQAQTANVGAMPKDVDSMLHSGHQDDGPFVVGEQDRNAEAGPSFKHPPVPESAHVHMLPEPRGSEGMTKDFDYRKFNEPLLDCINSLPDHAQNPSHIRVILEAYYSQSTLDRAPAIKIDGGEYDEYPPPEFKYSDEVYYSEKVPKPWLGKGCECVGPCSENSECFCLKRQEMYFASYVTDPFAGPLKGFAHNE